MLDVPSSTPIRMMSMSPAWYREVSFLWSITTPLWSHVLLEPTLQCPAVRNWCGTSDAGTLTKNAMVQLWPEPLGSW